MNGEILTDLGLLLPELILICAALALILAARRVQNSATIALVTIISALAAAVAAVWLLPQSPKMGFGVMIIMDGYSQFFKVLIASALALASLLSARLNTPNAPVANGAMGAVRPAEYHALLLLASTGMMVAGSAMDLLSLYLALELTTLCAYILVGITVDRPRSNEAAIKYFLLGCFASAFLLYGISLAYGVTGATDFQSISSVLSEGSLRNNQLLFVAIGLMTAGLAFKISAVPFHAWAPDAYQGASAPVAAFLAAASKVAGLAALGRVCLVAFASEARLLFAFLTGLAVLSMVFGSVIALAQTNMKRLLAYSSITHAGYALLGFVSGTPDGASATMTYAFFYVFMTLGAFGVVIALGERGENLEGYHGLAVQRRGTAALMLLFLLSLTGIPPTAGFVAKFVVIQSVLNTGHVALAVLAVVCSVVSAFVYLRVALLMYMKDPQADEPLSCPLRVSAALAVAALVTVIGGLFPGSLALWAVPP